MKMSNLLLPTLKELPAEAELISHQLMMRAGLMNKLASGIYNYLPLGYRVIKKVEDITREEMDAMGGQELLMPALNPAELWMETGRWEEMGENMFRLKDRHSRDFCLGMTHEEVITDISRRTIKSYKNLPAILYQIQTKFRDEPRPRAGIIRAREFIMKDMYSFHGDAKSLNETYEKAYQAYLNTFKRCGLKTEVVLADPGPMGGGECHEFTVLCNEGEDTVFICPGCGYAASADVADYYYEKKAVAAFDGKPAEKVSTPDVKTIRDLTDFLKRKPSDFIKTIIYEADGNLLAVLVRGDREINETKLKRILGTKNLLMATEEQILELTGGPLGFSGPAGLNGVRIISDFEIQEMKDAVTGANEKDMHFINVNYGRDFKVSEFYSVRNAVDGDICPRCKATALGMKRGIELGHIFKLGTRYSADMKATYLDETGAEKPFIMGCYGIGITRIVATLIEQSHDKDGIIWPMSIAPYQVLVMPVISNDEKKMSMASAIYDELKSAGVEVILDDRDARPGVKFKDADLVGFPIRITVGDKAVKELKVELRMRATGETLYIERGKVLESVKKIIADEIEKLKK